MSKTYAPDTTEMLFGSSFEYAAVEAMAYDVRGS